MTAIFTWYFNAVLFLSEIVLMLSFCFFFCWYKLELLNSSKVQTMALSGGLKNRGELRIHERLDDLSADLADFIAEISDASVKERGAFAIALSGGSLIGLMGYLYLIFFI